MSLDNFVRQKIEETERQRISLEGDLMRVRQQLDSARRDVGQPNDNGSAEDEVKKLEGEEARTTAQIEATVAQLEALQQEDEEDQTGQI